MVDAICCHPIGFSASGSNVICPCCDPTIAGMSQPPLWILDVKQCCNAVQGRGGDRTLGGCSLFQFSPFFYFQHPQGEWVKERGAIRVAISGSHLGLGPAVSSLICFPNCGGYSPPLPLPRSPQASPLFWMTTVPQE